MPVHIFGARSGTQQEFADAAKLCATFSPFGFGKLDETLKIIRSAPIYLSIDLDVLDPAFAPGVGTPEPGGVSSPEFIETLLWVLNNANIVAADVVELSPQHDPSGASAMIAAKIVREILLGASTG